MKVIAYGTVYECDKAVKGTDYVYLYKSGNKTASFEGVSDFAGYSIEGGEWSTPELTAEERLAAVEIENADLKEQLDLILSGATS